MKQYICPLLVVLLCSTSVLAQDATPEEGNTKKFDKSRLFTGGSFGATFGDFTFVNISPQLGYRFSQMFAAGAGVNFQYYGTKTRNFATNEVLYKDNVGVAGLNVFGRMYPISYLVLHVQPELNYTWGKRKYPGNTPNEKIPGRMVPSCLVGGGASIPSGGAGSFTIMLLYDLVQDARSPYSDKPFVNFGYNIGF